ncbi:FAD-binding protein [Schumannella sp. 10F1B-5-1]|uniref:FAD-binding protein n=1 Tax=Schumannella sp. 10F1B-5-1 TaxID=2590780 RepID=UPI0011328189|nr:FAD-binding protein [Schumannella sp. 10F1B-5-1]TPW70185.1 FAD-binding protein [Schumannella sp. 10F1B-5-1]
MADELNWGRNLVYSARELHCPTSIAQLRGIVAASRGLRPLGTRHSFSSIADTTGDLIDMTALPRVFELDPDAQTVTVDAGVRYGEVAPRIHAAGFALKNLGSLPHISVGGATATGTHGSGDANPPLSASVSAVELVTSDGGTTRIARGDDGFDGAVVSLGALGLATRLTLDLLPTFEVRQDSYETLHWGDVLDRLDELFGAAYSVCAFTRWVGDDFGSALVKSTERELPEELLGARRVPVAPAEPGAEPSSSTEVGGVPGPWHLRLPHFRIDATPSVGDELQSEWFVPRARAREALELVRELGEAIEPHLHVAEIRTTAAETQWLSGASATDTLTIGFTWKHHPAEVGRLIPQVEERLVSLGSRPHWGKLTAQRDLEALYPHLDDWRALADRMDPRGKLRNRWLDERLFS